MPDDMLRFSCPNCGKSLKAPQLKAGLSATCPTCKTAVRIPGGIHSVAPPTKPEIIPASQVPNRQKSQDHFAVAPLPMLEDDGTTQNPQVVVIRQETQHTREIVRYVEVPAKRKKKDGKKPPQNLLLILYMLTGAGATMTAMICTWFLGLPLLVMALILGCFLASKHKATVGVTTCIVVSSLGIMTDVTLGAIVVMDGMAKDREYQRDRRR